MRRLIPVVVLLLGFVACLGLRLVIGGAAVAQSVPAGLVFALGLLLLTLAAGGSFRRPTGRDVLTGLAGLVVLCAPVALRSVLSLRPLQSAAGFPEWAVAVVVIASAEELFLRGALYDAVERLGGPVWAVAVGATCFGLLHVPLYGWHVVPLDLAVGVVLGGLRHGTGSPTAPAIAHVGADFVGWFVR